MATDRLRQALFDWIWSSGVRMRDVAKRLGVSGPVEPLLGYLGPRLIRPPGHETLVELPNGYSLWIPANFPSYRNYTLGVYERKLNTLLPRLVRTDMSAVDVGANVGFYTVALSRLVGDRGKVFAFEADDLAFTFLKRNLIENGCQNVTAVNAAVSERPGLVHFVPDSVERGFVDTTSRPRSVQVPAISLDSYFGAMSWPRIDFIKLDIEGSEQSAVDGMTQLSQRNPALSMVMEYNRETIHRSGSTEEQLSSGLRRAGFQYGWVIERDLVPLPAELQLPHTGSLFNLLLTKGTLGPNLSAAR